MDELDLRIRTYAYGSFVRTGTAPTAADTAEALDLDPAEVEASYGRLHAGRAIVLEPGSTTTIRMLNPFSAIETHHMVEAAGRSWYANCAWDALGVAAALHEDADVSSRCADCGDPLELEVRDGLLARGADLLVHILVPARHWWDDIVFT